MTKKKFTAFVAAAMMAVMIPALMSTTANAWPTFGGGFSGFAGQTTGSGR